MKQETFEVIKTNLEERIKACKEHLDHIITTDDLKTITVGEAQELKAWASKESAIMTEIVMVDFYHIIGMGELTVLQTNTFIKLIKEYMSYRSDLKTIGAHFSLDNLPNLPSSSEFTLKQLGNITLTSKVRGRNKAASTFIETNTIGDYTKACQNLADSATADEEYGPFKIEGDTIILPTAFLTKFIKAINPNLSKGKITSAASYQDDSGNSYAKIFWQYTDKTHTEIKAIVPKENGYLAGIKNNLKKAFAK